jgi:S1-C subfamily serine protease
MYDDEGPASGAPMPAPDRLWRHPAEAGAEQAAANMAARKAGGRRWPEILMSFVAGMAFVGLAWIFSDQPEKPIQVIEERVVAPPSTLILASDAPVGFDEWAFEISKPNRGSVVGLHLGGDVAHDMAQAILYRDDGLLLASAHSLIGAEEISAVLPDGRGLPALVLASDQVSGVAVLKIASPEIEPAIFSNGNVALRDRLVGIAGHAVDGEPLVQTVDVLGEDHVASLPNGDLLSGVYRLSSELDPTWAGAPIVDENGGVVAMVVATADGANYAIPTGRARQIATDLLESGTTETVSWLGVELASGLTDDLQQQRGVRGGVLVTRVWNESPAARGGLAAGDVIIGIDSVNVVELSDLSLALTYTNPDDVVEIRYVRRPLVEGPEATDPEEDYVAEGQIAVVRLGAKPKR